MLLHGTAAAGMSDVGAAGAYCMLQAPAAAHHSSCRLLMVVLSALQHGLLPAAPQHVAAAAPPTRHVLLAQAASLQPVTQQQASGGIRLAAAVEVPPPVGVQVSRESIQAIASDCPCCFEPWCAACGSKLKIQMFCLLLSGFNGWEIALPAACTFQSSPAST